MTMQEFALSTMEHTIPVSSKNTLNILQYTLSTLYVPLMHKIIRIDGFAPGVPPNV